jgi:hypothetical protein
MTHTGSRGDVIVKDMTRTYPRKGLGGVVPPHSKTLRNYFQSNSLNHYYETDLSRCLMIRPGSFAGLGWI